MRRLFALTAALLGILALPAVAAADLSITPSTVSVPDGTMVTFNATADPGAVLTWTFDDGSAPVTGTTTVQHQFSGVRQHVVTVTDNLGNQGTITVDVTPYVVQAGTGTVQWTSSPYPAAIPPGLPPGFKFPMFNATAKPSRMRANHAGVIVSCLFGATGACHGTVILRSAKPVRDRPGRKARVIELGRAAFTLRPNSLKGIAIPLSRRELALMKKLGRLQTTLVATARDDAGNTADKTLALTLTRPA